MFQVSWRVLRTAVVLSVCVLVRPEPFWARASAAAAPPPASVVFAHINDVYEIDAIEGGAFGGMSRVATILDRLRRAGTPVLATLGGDFLSPSAIGTARVNGEAVAGRQMVEVLNAIGLQWATLGNHEFDLSEAAFRTRMSEAKFTTVVSNVTDAQGRLFPGTVETAVATVRSNGRLLRIGLVGLCTDFNRKPWVKYLPPIDIARAKVAAFKGKVDAIVALTHLSLPEDQAVVEAVPEIDLVLGGHEHENWYLRRGPAFAPIVKADANARSVAVVSMRFAPTGRPDVSVRFELVDRRVPMQPRVQTLVRRWIDAAFEAFTRDGFSPATIVTTIPMALDGREQTVRRRAGDLTTLIAEALKRETSADIGILNGGAIRIDDVLQPGPVRQYDIIRIMPFGGTVLKATIEGALLARVLDAGVQNLGIGGFLHLAGAVRQDSTWIVNGKPLDPAARYTIGVPEFLLTGGESRLDFLTRTNPQVHDVQEFRDIRVAVMDELKARFGGGSGVLGDRLKRIAGAARQ